MKQLKTKPFPYFVGIHSLEELITKESRVCVLNILGNESRKVTPVSHFYSGGNVVAGVQYGRRGKLETPIGDIPVHKSVREVIDHGIQFDCGVIYLPPTAVSQAVTELIRHNELLKRIIIVTEKVPTRDALHIRAMAQEAGVDVIGANCLGIANVWDHVRIGGALGGDHPEETLKKGSIAIHSNSGNFTTTIAEYLQTAGFGVSTAVSSGKDVLIHFALPEFLYAAQNDPRTKAVVLYVEPGAYYEKMALDWIQDRTYGFNKPIVVCVTGRWKRDIVRPCGHAGAMAGSGDDAESKERFFDEYFGVGVYDPNEPIVSKRGVRVGSIQHIPEALAKVFEKIDEVPDFASTGDLSLKPWIADNFLPLPESLNIPLVKPLAPYDKQIVEINKQVGANYLRQSMRNKSGASKMNSETQVSELHGKSILDLSTFTFEENIYFALAKVMPEKRDISSINMLLNLFLKMDAKRMDLVDLAKRNGATPNAYIGSQISLIGDKELLSKTRENTRFIIDLIREYGINDVNFNIPAEAEDFIRENLLTDEEQRKSEVSDMLLSEVKKSKKDCVAVRVCQHIIAMAEKEGKEIKNNYEFLLGSVFTCIFWKPMLEKRMSKQTVEDSVSYFYIVSRIVAYSVIDRENNKFWQRFIDKKISNINNSFTDTAFKVLFNRVPTTEELFELQTLLGLTITNGPGTISAKGAKESVSAKNNISFAFTGFLTNTGLAHGGNGFEAVEFLTEIFLGDNETAKSPNISDKQLEAIAHETAVKYAKFKQAEKESGKMQYRKIPCVNHPVFKGNAVNIDPRESYVRNLLKQKNIVNKFLEFYHFLVQELFKEGVTSNIFCVNVDAVLAVISLKLVWEDLIKGKINKRQVQDLVFILFIFGRSIGVAAEIADHRDRGQDMDCRTKQEELSFVL